MYGIDSGLSVMQAATDLNNFDVALIIYSINDWQNSCFMDAYVNAMTEVCELFAGTTCEPIFIFPWYCYRLFEPDTARHTYSYANRLGITQDRYIDQGIEIVNRYGYKYINMYTLSGVNKDNYTQWLNNDDGIYVHCLAPLADKACEIILSDMYNSGKIISGLGGENLAYKLYNNITPVDFGTSTAGVSTAVQPALYFNKNYSANFIGLIPRDPDQKTTIRIKGSSMAYGTDYVVLKVHKTTTEYTGYTIVAGADFDFTVTDTFETFGLSCDMPTTSPVGNYCILDKLEVYASQPMRQVMFDCTKNSQVSSTNQIRTYVKDGCICFDPASVTLTAALPVMNYVFISPLHLNNTVDWNGLVKRGSTYTTAHMFNRGRYIVCLEALQSGDKLMFKVPPIPITPTACGENV